VEKDTRGTLIAEEWKKKDTEEWRKLCHNKK
jgi:hypothetical protein